MDHEVGPWKMAFVNGLTSVVRLHKKIVLRALGPSLGVNRMWTKKTVTMHQKVEVLIVLIHAQKGQFLEKKSKFDHSLVFSWALLVFTSS
jgi:hypothetical protein